MGETHTIEMAIGTTPEAPPGAPSSEPLIAGKFKTEADLEKATLELIKKQNSDGGLEKFYKDLESQLGKPPTQEVPPEQQPGPPGEQQPPEGHPPAADSDTVRDILKDSGLDFDALSEEFSTSDGKLSEDSYAKLAKAGFNRTLVDNYIKGQVALAAQRDAQLYKIAGGEDSYNTMIQWAAVNLTPEEKDVYNKALNSESATLAVEGLFARYQRSTGKTGRILEGTPSPGGLGGYQSEAQMKADMRDPRYTTDQAFRDLVAQRLSRTTTF